MALEGGLLAGASSGRHYCAYFSIRRLDIKTMSGGLDAVKRRMSEIAESEVKQEASNVEIDLYTTLEIVNENAGAGLQIREARSLQEPCDRVSHRRRYPYPNSFSCDQPGDNVARQLVRAREEGEFLF